MEPYGNLVEPLCHEMSINEDEYFTIEGSRKAKEIKDIIEHHYEWLIPVDFQKQENIKTFLIFGIIQKISKNQDSLIGLRKMAQRMNYL